MENGTDSSLSILIPLTEYSEEFKRKILHPLQSAFLYQESKVSFKYKAASLFKNPTLKQKYDDFRTKRRQAGYSEDDLEETYGFLLFDDVNKAKELGQTGVLTGTSSCSSLGDPLKGVYISMFSDCLGPERWQDGQSGYIAIIKLTTGRVRRVPENHTQDVCSPTVGFDCHVSQLLASVTTQTSFSLAFERTQCYIYELLDNGSNKTSQSPSLTCPFAVVAFSYRKRRTLAMKEPKPRGLISYEILRYLPVLRLDEGTVKKPKFEPNKELNKVLANPMQTYKVLLSQGQEPVTTPAPTVNDTNSSLSSSFKVLPANPLHSGSKDDLIVKNTPALLEISDVKAITGGSVAPVNRQTPKKPDKSPNKNNPGDKKTQTPDIPAELVVNVTCGKTANEKSPVSPTKFETCADEAGIEAKIAPNDFQVLNKTDDQRVQNLQMVDVPTEVMLTFNSMQKPFSPEKYGPGSDVDGAILAQNDLPVLKRAGDLTVNALQSTSPDVPAELIVSLTSEQSVAAESRVNPVPGKKYLPAKRNGVLGRLKIACFTKNQRRKLLWKHSKGKMNLTEACCEPPGIEKCNNLLQVDHVSTQDEQQTATSNLDWDQLNMLIVKGSKVGPISAKSIVIEERNPGKRTLLNTVAMDLGGPLREKSDRWNLKPVLSECGRVLVPYGSRDNAHRVKSFREKSNVKWLGAPSAVMDNKLRCASPELARCEMKIVKYPVGNPDQNILQETEDGQDLVQAGVHKHTHPISDQCATKHEPRGMLSSRKTRKHHFDLGKNAETEPCQKKNRIEADVKSSSSSDTAVGLEESTLLSVTHGETPNMTKKSEVKYTLIRKALLETQIKKAQVVCRPPSIYPKWKRIKTLRKHIDISREHFKKTWWMHLKSSHASETVKECTRNYSLRKKTPALNTSTDALNLLADLALGANNELVSSQPVREVESQPQSRLKKSDGSKDVTCDNKESVLHVLLGQPVTQPLAHALVDDAELIRLLCKEHCYSLPQYALIPSGLPGAPFQVPPLSGSTGLVYRKHTRFGVQTPHASDDLEDENQNCGPSDHSGKRMNLFNRNRTLLCNNGSVQVTRQWKEKYDFDRDSRFASDSKDRTIIRALHGPWDFSIRDTMEDMQLIVHMWIAFFYSRSTARFIDFGSDLANLRSDEGSAAEITTQAQFKLKHNPFSLPLGPENTPELYFSNSSDLSKTSSDQGSEILDWSVGNSDHFKVLPLEHPLDSVKTPSSPTTLKEKPTSQSYQAMILPAETRKKCSKNHWSLSQDDKYLQHNSSPSLKEDVTHIQAVGTENRDIFASMRHSLDKSITEEIDLKGGSENAYAMEIIKLLKHRDPSFQESELYEDAGNASPSILQTDRNVSERETSETEKAKDCTSAKDFCKECNNHFVKASDKHSCIFAFSTENCSDISNHPLTIVMESEQSQSEVQSIEPNHQEFSEKWESLTGIELQSRVVCQNTITDQDVLKYSSESVSEVGISNNATSESISPENCKMTAFSSQIRDSVENEIPYESKRNFHFVTGTVKDEKGATVAPKHLQPNLVQLETVKYLGSNSELVKVAPNMLQDIHGRAVVPSNGFSGKNTLTTDPRSQVVGVLQDRSVSCPKIIPGLFPQRVLVLKVGETGQSDVVGDTDETPNGNIYESTTSIDNQQSNLLPHEMKVESIKDRQDKVEETPCGVVNLSCIFEVQNTSPTMSWCQVEGSVENQVMTLNSLKSVGKLLPRSESVLQVAETRKTEGTILAGGEMGSTIGQKHHSILIDFQSVKQLEADVESSEGRDQNKEEQFPFGSLSEEKTPPTGTQNSLEETFLNKTGTKLNTSPQNIIEPSSRRVSVLKVSESSQRNIAGWSDYKSFPPFSDNEKEKPTRVLSEPCISGSDIPDSRMDTKSILSDKCSQIETTNRKDRLGQPSTSNDAKEINTKLLQAVSTSQCLLDEPLDLSVISPFKHKAGDFCYNVQTCSKKSWTTKYTFFLLVTSGDSFFEETKACLEEAGHTAVQPDQFFVRKESSSMLVIVRNEDISTHLFEIPRLLELKMSPDVWFAGIDEPQDLLNFTHQELFLGGGFVMLDQSSLESLNLDKVKGLLKLLQDLNKSEKWKWLLHYRDSRRFKENARISTEEEEKKNLLSWSQEIGLSAVLPYHECDAKSRDHPDYLGCLVHLQVQNIAARFPVFLTDVKIADKFEKSGILTATLNSFLKRFST
ncbi:uncharacterized protein tasor2 [Stigmatopora argus]